MGSSANDLVAWLRQHPGLDVRNVQGLTVNGYSAVSLVISARSDWTGTCPETETKSFVAVPIFFRQDNWHWALAPNTSYGVVLIDIGGGHTVAVMIDTAKEADLDRFMATAMPIIQTFNFPQP